MNWRPENWDDTYNKFEATRQEDCVPFPLPPSSLFTSEIGQLHRDSLIQETHSIESGGKSRAAFEAGAGAMFDAIKYHLEDMRSLVFQK